MDTCVQQGRDWGEPADEIFERYLGLMKKYEDYFFMEPWPDEYDYRRATDITDEDWDFLLDNINEFYDRCTTVCLRKNLSMKEGFMGYWGMYWTQQKIDEVVYLPIYEKVFGEFESLRNDGRTVKDVLSVLKGKYSCQIIHDSFIDVLERKRSDEVTRKVFDEMFDLLHTAEGLPSCDDTNCDWYWRTRYAKKSQV